MWRKLHMCFPFDLTNPLTGTYSKDTYANRKDVCMRLFTVTTIKWNLYNFIKDWKQPRRLID